MIGNIRVLQRAKERDTIGDIYNRVFRSIKRHDNDGNIVGTFDRIDVSIRHSSGDTGHHENHLMATPCFRMTNPTPERMLKAVRKFISLYYPEYSESNPGATGVNQYVIDRINDEDVYATMLMYERKGGWGWLHVDARPAKPYSAHIDDPEIGPVSLIIGVN